jgi:hypothetical protein
MADDLAKKSQNPVGNMISLPIEYWHYDGMPNDSTSDMVIAKPVYPVNLGEYNLINRFIVPYIWVDANTGGNDFGDLVIPQTHVSKHGLGNIQYFINYNLPGGWSLSMTPIITADWEKDSDDRWLSEESIRHRIFIQKWIEDPIWSFRYKGN